ncbi:hypothetical protein Tco_1183321, partial [Tanacetum coccineum]
VALDHYRDAFSVIYLIYAHSSLKTNASQGSTQKPEPHLLTTDITHLSLCPSFSNDYTKALMPLWQHLGILNALLESTTYQDFMKCQPLFFKGTEGVVELTQWTVSHDVAYAMTWTDLKKKMTNKYAESEDKKTSRDELWNLKVKVLMYLAKSTFPGSGIIGVVRLPKTMKDAIEMANLETDGQKIASLLNGKLAEDTGARGLVHALGGGEANQDLNDMEDDISVRLLFFRISLYFLVVGPSKVMDKGLLDPLITKLECLIVLSWS